MMGFWSTAGSRSPRSDIAGRSKSSSRRAPQWKNGVVDIRVKDEAEATAAARRYLGYFGGPRADWEAADQAPLDDALPENRRRAYDVRPIIERLFDVESVMELRAGFGRPIVTALARLEGRTVGVIANDTSDLRKLHRTGCCATLKPCDS